MYNKIVKPSGILDQYIEYYYVLESSADHPISGTGRVYPYGNIVLVFHYGHPHLFQKKDQSPTIEPSTVICGQQTSYYDLTPRGNVGMIFVLFKPFGAGMFFDLSMNELLDSNIAFENVVNHEAAEIEERIREAVDLSKRIEIIENFLFQRLTKRNHSCVRLVAAFQKMDTTIGRVTIPELAETACLGTRQFRRQFSRYVGMKPKQYLRIFRFQQLLRLKRENTTLNYAQLALDCGFYDQSHFINSFKNMTGLTPGEFFK